MNEIIRHIDSSEYHLWTDVLHACSLSSQANNSWDRSSYVRWTIVTGWTVLEMLFRKALEDEKIGHSFKNDVNLAVKRLELPRINWGEGVWQVVLSLKEQRKIYVHTKIDQDNLFLEAQLAVKYVDDVRECIKAIYSYVHKPLPKWINIKDDIGWDNGRQGGINAIIERQGATIDNPLSIIIAYTYKGREHITEVLPEGADYIKVVLELVNTIKIAINEVKVYQGGKVIWERPLMIRGSF
jgi:hypothetical protein